MVIGEEFDDDNTNQADTPLEIVQMMKGVTNAGDHMRQKVMQILHVAPSTRSVCTNHVIKIVTMPTIYTVIGLAWMYPQC